MNLNTMKILILSAFLPVTSSATEQGSMLEKLQQDLIQLSQRTQPSVVTISATFEYNLIEEEDSFIWNRRKESKPVEWTNIGSGIILAPHYIVTRLSVVQGSPFITVTYCDGNKEEAFLAGGDPEMGLAVLEVENSGWKAAIPGQPEKVIPGCLVAILGNSLGVAPAVSLGIVNCIRSDGILQISAIISAGTAGGPIFDVRGHFIGLLSSLAHPPTEEIYVGPMTGLGETLLAYPADRILEKADAIIAEAERSRGWIGVTGDDWPGKVGGVLVRKITPGSPAEEGGLVPLDIIVGIDGQEVNYALDLAAAIARHEPDDTIKLGVLRGKEDLHTLAVRVGDRRERKSFYQTAEGPPTGALQLEFERIAPQPDREYMMMRMRMRQVERQLKSIQSMMKKH